MIKTKLSFLLFFIISAETFGCLLKHQIAKMNEAPIIEVNDFLKNENWEIQRKELSVEIQNISRGKIIRYYLWTNYNSEKIEIFEDRSGSRLVAYETDGFCFLDLKAKLSKAINPRVNVYDDGRNRFNFFEVTDLYKPKKYYVFSVLKGKNGFTDVINYYNPYKDTPQKSSAIDKSKSEPDEGSNQIFSFVEEDPIPPGGDFQRYIQENLIYPSEALSRNIEGKVNVSFVVGRDGGLRDIKITRELGYGCDEEAIRILEKMPNWTPGKSSGKSVLVKMDMPIVFKIKKNGL
jgi:TonB family protein